MLVANAEKILGRTRRIVRSEVESRESIGFASQPAGLTFQLDRTGIIAEGASGTTRFAPEARILSITISS